MQLYTRHTAAQTYWCACVCVRSVATYGYDVAVFCQYTGLFVTAKKTSVITVFGVNSKRFGYNVASGAQCDIPINCAIQILLLN